MFGTVVPAVTVTGVAVAMSGLSFHHSAMKLLPEQLSKNTL